MYQIEIQPKMLVVFSAIMLSDTKTIFGFNFKTPLKLEGGEI